MQHMCSPSKVRELVEASDYNTATIDMLEKAQSADIKGICDLIGWIDPRPALPPLPGTLKPGFSIKETS